MKHAQGYLRRLPSHTLVLVFGLILGIAGCGGSDSTPVAPTQTPQGTESLAAETTSAETPAAPPGGMELPSNLDVSDTPAATPEAGTAFELPE